MLGGHAVAQCLRNEDVKHIFSVPGESYIAVVDGLVNFPEIKLITNRQEGCAAFMAEGYAKATRTPGVCIVTRGPGATNASIAVHSAKYDSAPLVLLVGQVSRAARGREAGQEIDYGRFFGSIAKWVIEINDPKQIPRIMSRAFHLARTGRPGPVVVALPRDVTGNRHRHHDDRADSGDQAQCRSGGHRNVDRPHQCGAQTGAARSVRELSIRTRGKR